MAVVPGIVQVLPDGSVSVTQSGGHSPRFQTTKLTLQKDEESAVRSQLTAARMRIRSHHCPVESLSVPVNCRVFSRFTGPYAVQPLQLSAAQVSPPTPFPLHAAFSQWELLSVCHMGQFSPAPGPLHVLSVDSDHPPPTSYLPGLTAAHLQVLSCYQFLQELASLPSGGDGAPPLGFQSPLDIL